MEPSLRSERFRIRRRLGAGGMGVVYEAVDTERDAVVALKTLQQASPAAIARFKREFRSLADVIHPNLVALHELVADGEQVLFFTMELVDGVPFPHAVRPLSARERDTMHSADTEVTRTVMGAPQGLALAGPPTEPSLPPLDEPRLRDALRQLAEGVQAIHDAGMLHRDLKGSNVLVTPSGRVVVLDFGLATELAAENLANVEERPLEGTATYMSPEQGARMPLTPASDWYSVGVILYLTLTGRLPFMGAREDVLMNKQQFEPLPPSQVAPDVPADLDALCVELLRRDPDARPTGPEILRRLGSSAATAAATTIAYATSTASYDSLVGRFQELAALQDAYRCSRGRPVLVRLVGSSGVGKSHLARAFVDGIEPRERPLILRGRCYERESVPFKAVDSLVDALARHLVRLPPLEVEGLMPRDGMALARLFPVLRQIEAMTADRRRTSISPDPHEQRRRAFDGLRELLARLADRQPLLLVLDDLQWGDVDSASLLASLLLAPEPPACLVIANYRSEDEPTSPFLTTFAGLLEGRRLDERRVEVEPLTHEQAVELALIHLGRHPSLRPQARRIADEANGNPFFVEELARHLRDRHDAPAAISLSEVLRERLGRLPEPAARLLSTVCVAGRPLAQNLAFRAADVDDPAALALLKAGSFLRTRSADGTSYVEPYHDRVRETVTAMLDADLLRERHRRIAQVLDAMPGADPETLAIHFRGAGELERAGECAARAAERAAAGLAFDRAAHLYRMAIELLGARADRSLRVGLGEALANAGRAAEAAQVYLSALDGASTAEKLDLQCRAAGQLLFSGRIDEGVAAYNEVLGAVGLRMARTPRRALGNLLLTRARLALRGIRYKEQEEREIPASQLMRIDVAFAVAEGLGMADVIRAADFQARFSLLALRAGEPKRVAKAIAAEAVFHSLRGAHTRPRTDAMLEVLRELVERLGDPYLRALSTSAGGLVAFNHGNWLACLDACRRGERILRDECVSYPWELSTTQLFIGFSLAVSGRVREMVEMYPRMLEEALERGDLYVATSLRATLGLYVPLTEDDPAKARREVEGALAAWSPNGFHLQHCNGLNSLACIDLYEGTPQAALGRIDAAWPAIERSLLLRTQTLRRLLLGARGRAAFAIAARTGDRRARALVTKVRRKLEREGPAYATSQARLLAAGEAHLEGREADTLARLAEAELLATEADLALEVYAMRWVRGTLTGGEEGAALIREAETFFHTQDLRNPAGVVRIFAGGFVDA